MRTYLALVVAIAAVVGCSDDGQRRRRGGGSDGGEGGEGASGGVSGTAPRAGASGSTQASGGSGNAGSGKGGSGNAAGSGIAAGSGASGGTDGAGTGQGASSGSGNAPSSGGEGGDDTNPGSGGADGGSGAVAGTGAVAGSGAEGGSGGGPPLDGRPIVEILFDGSSSIFEGTTTGWSDAYDALVTSGTLSDFTDELDIGLTLFQGSNTASTSETDPLCATFTKVTASSESPGAIKDALDALAASYSIDVKWETPSAFAMRDVISTLSFLPNSENRPKYVLYVTDGEPNTCIRLDPQCGQDHLIRAVQDARTTNIKTLVLGIGSIAQGATSCAVGYARCGPEHLQDIANAGAGQPVVTPPEQYAYAGCHLDFMLTAAYASAGGNARVYSSVNTGGATAELAAALRAIADGAVP